MFDIFQVTSSVTVWVPVTPLKIAVATKVAELPAGDCRAGAPVDRDRQLLPPPGRTVTVIVRLVVPPSGADRPRSSRFRDGCEWPGDELANDAGVELATNYSSEELQVDLPVTSFVLPSLKVPVAVVC